MNNRIILGKLAKQAKAFVDERGGSEALSAEAQKLKDIAKGTGSISDKAKQAAASAQSFAKAKPGEPEADAAAGQPATGQPNAPGPGAAAPAAAPAPSGPPPAFDE